MNEENAAKKLIRISQYERWVRAIWATTKFLRGSRFVEPDVQRFVAANLSGQRVFINYLKR